MTSTRTIVTTVLVAGAAALGIPAAAGADTICVDAPAGTACNSVQPDLQSALDAAFLTPGVETVAVGNPGFPLQGPFLYPKKAAFPIPPVTIKGVGASRPVLTAAAGDTVLGLFNATVEDVDVLLPSAAAGIGIEAVDTSLKDVRVTGPGAKQLGAIGIKAVGNMSIDDTSVSGTGATGLQLAAGSFDVDASHLRTTDVAHGIDLGDGSRLQLKDSRIAAGDTAVDDRGTATIGTSLLETTAPDARAVSAGDGKVAFDHVSIVHRGPVDGTDSALEFHPVDFGGQADLSSILIAGYTRGIRRDTSENNAPYPITIRDSVWDPAHDVLVAAPNTGGVTETGDAHVDPKLVDVAGGDFRLRGSSAAVDRDTQTDPGYADLDGQGLVDGDGNASKLADAGAFEYRRLAPSIDTADVPASGTTGQALAFSANASDADGDSVQLAWEFGDGTIGAGGQAAHTYAAPGIYSVTLHVTDEAGLGATRTFSVAVTAAPAPGAGGAVGAVGADTIAPKLSQVRLSKSRLSKSSLRARSTRAPSLRFSLSERAKVRISVAGVSSVRSLSAGRHSIGLASALRRPQHLRIGALKVKIRATDLAGNRSPVRTVTLHIVA